MSSESLRGQHWYIADHVPDTLQLTESFPGNWLGSHVTPKVQHGDYVPVDPQHAYEANFEGIEALSSARDLQGEFAVFKDSLLGQNGNPITRVLVEKLPDREQHLIAASLFASSVATEFFGDVLSGDRSEENRRIGWTPIDPERHDTLVTKPLSDTADSGACLEYSIFMQQVFSRIGEDVSLAVGFQQLLPGHDSYLHAFLLADEGHFAIDPLMVAVLGRDGSPVPMGIYGSTSEETFISAPYASVEYAGLVGAGDTCRYSASPIAPSSNAV